MNSLMSNRQSSVLQLDSSISHLSKQDEIHDLVVPNNLQNHILHHFVHFYIRILFLNDTSVFQTRVFSKRLTTGEILSIFGIA